MRLLTTAVLLLGGLLLGKVASAADYVVTPNGSDSASGLAGAPFKTIQRAVNQPAPGDTITVEDGTYAGFFMKSVAGTASQRIIVRAKNRGGAKITSPSATSSDPNDNIQLVSASFVTIDGFDVSGAPRAGISIRTLGDDTGTDTRGDIVQNCRSHDNGAGVTAGRHDGIFTGFALDVIIQDNEVDNNSEHGIYVSNSADNPIIRRNLSHDNKANGLQINADVSTGGDGIITNWLMESNVSHHNGGAAGINLDGACSGILRNNLVYANANGGITMFMGDAAVASHANLVVNNTVYDASGSRSALQIADGANDNIVFNNVLYSSHVGLEVQSVTGLVHGYNLVSSYSGASAGDHESSPAPTDIFVDPAASNFHPSVAAIDKGTASLGGASAPATDVDGNPRPAGSAPDIGCYENGAGVVPPPDAGPPPPPPPPPPVDAGTPHDAGHPPTTVDAGPPTTVDAGPPTTVDAGTPTTVDAGAAHDAGDHSVDAGETANDSGVTPTGDAGNRGAGAAPDAGETPAGFDPTNKPAGCSASAGIVEGNVPHPAMAFLIVAAVAAIIRIARTRKQD